MITTINLVAHYNSSGQPTYEEVRVDALGRHYRLLQSPGFTPGLAAGDLFVVDANYNVTVIERGGNVCVQLLILAHWEELERIATPIFTRLGGWLDGAAPKIRVYTIPHTAGFAAIEQGIDEIKQRLPELEWYYGNVYDPADGVTPLGWWNELGN